MKNLKIIATLALITSATLFVELGCGSIFVPHAVPVLTTNEVTGLVVTNYVTNYTVASGVTNALAKAQAATQKIPTPWGELATTALGISTGVLAWIAKKKSDHAALVPALIAGIEASPNNAEVKTSVQRIATATGIEKRLNREVRRVKSAKVKLDFGKTP